MVLCLGERFGEGEWSSESDMKKGTRFRDEEEERKVEDDENVKVNGSDERERIRERRNDSGGY